MHYSFGVALASRERLSDEQMKRMNVVKEHRQIEANNKAEIEATTCQSFEKV